MKTSEKLSALQAALDQAGVDGLLIPRSDRFQSKYPTAQDERLMWLTAFTGSAGEGAVLTRKTKETPDNAAVVMTDPRYTLTIREEVDAALFDIENTNETSALDWSLKRLPKGSKLGFDPKLHTVSEQRAMLKKAQDAGITLTPLKNNPIDQIWTSRPNASTKKAFALEEKYSGLSSIKKREELAQTLREAKLDHHLISATDSLCWLLNIRGYDTEYSPTLHMIGLVDATNGAITVYCDPRKIDAKLSHHIGNKVTIKPFDNFEKDLQDLSKECALKKQTISFDPARTPYYHLSLIAEAANAEIVTREINDPCILMKALKNETEQQNLRFAHIQDSAAWVKFLHWMDETLPSKGSPKYHEMDLSDKLDAFRREGKAFDHHGYPPIAGWGENGANIHYHSTGRGAEIGHDNLFLIDSGAQSKYGQTDITRAICVGTPSAEMKDRYTRALKGHIRLAMAVFPKGTNGAQLDTLARAGLWEQGLNYPHGTGHGIGYYLDVHEGPANIGPRSTQPLEPGMFLSNEPGFYKEGDFGIRLENEVLVQKWPFDQKADQTCLAFEQASKGQTEQEMLCFETITFVPFDRRLVDPTLLSVDELCWLNAYHAHCHSVIAPLLSNNEQQAWLKSATAPIEHPNLKTQPKSEFRHYRPS
jgi:Xaa-Pro aminopeptidase